MKMRNALALMLVLLDLPSCTRETEQGPVVITFPTSSVGAEGSVLRRQIARFMRAQPGIRVELQRAPDAADQRHQLYVQWLNARVHDPDILQLDVVWTPEFAAAGWLHPLDTFSPDLDDFFPAAIDANRYAGRVYALPWFLDVGMLYYRTDLVPTPPRTQAELVAQAKRLATDARHGLIFQGARYEGLVTVFLEFLTAYGGAVLDAEQRVVLDSQAAHAALEAMRAALHETHITPRSVLSFQEEQTRFAFQNGRAVFMRNWPYAYPLMEQAGSKVAGRFAVTAMPPAEGGRAAATLGGSQLAISAHSDHPEAAYTLLTFLLAPTQMLERARGVGQFPSRPSLYAGDALETALPIPPQRVLEILKSAVARPKTPVYAELSDILQIHVHRCLSGQERTREALQKASREITSLLTRVNLGRARGDRDGR